MTKQILLKLNLSPEVNKKLMDLLKLTQAKDRADVVAKALAVYDFLWEQKKRGVTTLIINSEFLE